MIKTSENKGNHVVIGAVLSGVILTLQMFAALLKVKLILTNFGYEYNSVYSSAGSVFSYLILIESGLSMAYLIKMYESYGNGDYERLQGLYYGLKKTMIIVSLVMVVGGMLIVLFYPLVIAENSIGIFEIRLLIALSGLKFIIPYMMTVARKQLLNVVGKSYMISIIDSLINLITDIIIIIIVLYTDWSFLVVAGVSLLMLIPSIFIYLLIEKHYEKIMCFKQDVTASYEAIEMTKDIAAQKVAYLVDNNIDQIILSTRDLLKTTVYSTFHAILSYPTSLINQVIASFRGYLGIQMNQTGKNSGFSLFRMLLSVNFYIATVISCVFIIQVKDFITLWVGEKYVAGSMTIILFGILLFRKCSDNAVTIARESKNVFKEAKKYAIIASIVNLILSLFLVRYFGITGLVIATLIADIFVMDLNYYKLVFSRIFEKKVDIHKEIIPSVLCFLMALLFSKYYSGHILADLTWIMFIIKSAIVIIISSVVIGIAYYWCSDYMRETMKTLFHTRKKG